jgi:hypothetical protein
VSFFDMTATFCVIKEFALSSVGGEGFLYKNFKIAVISKLLETSITL